MTPAPRPRPVLLLTVWALLLAVGAALAPLAQRTLGLPADLLSLVMLAPALACAVVLVRPGWAPPSWPAASAREVIRSAGVAVLAVGGLLAVLVLLTGRTPEWPDPADIGAPIAVLVALQAVGALGEELGWRGLVQRCGEMIARPLVVATVAGMLFGVTHLGYWPLGPAPLLIVTLVATLMSIAAVALGRGTLAQRMVPAVLVHLGVNLSALVLSGPGAPVATTPAMVAAAAVLCGIALVADRWMRRRTTPPPTVGRLRRRREQPLPQPAAQG